MKNINSYTELQQILAQNKVSYLLLYKGGADASDCSYKNLEEAEKNAENITVTAADVSKVKDIHEKYEIKTVPTLIKFNNLKLETVIKGCNDSSYYLSVFNNNYFQSTSDDKPQKTVIVYSTPTCSWCNRLKTYLKENSIKFTDIDVSKDQKAAEEMVKRSGQQGVPQSLINGQLIIGFDKNKIDNLLGIGR